jgi:hypothetical protein
MNEAQQMLASLRDQAIDRREQNRRAFPGVAEIVDSLTAAFGPVKVLHAIENGKEIGKPQPFDGIDANKIIAADDWHKAAQKRGVRK